MRLHITKEIGKVKFESFSHMHNVMSTKNEKNHGASDADLKISHNSRVSLSNNQK